jgi:nitrogen regulatory protein PII
MKKIEAHVMRFQLDGLKDALDSMGVGGMTVSEVFCKDNNQEVSSVFSKKPDELLPRLKLEVVVQDNLALQVAKTLATVASCDSHHPLDVLITPINTAHRIRTRDKDAKAL